ncbi:TetR/AcrR family transcriptional regulator [Mangrovicella endophytica]|uniref:TetR/AcrR family transcriptional regulator n=1 Tax=Mangrovicella endophytica TaxID=2066697 RepID=UPI000C9E10E4|nr:TetR/AcrR family transcriptional regulator [Mangrovicella endophytica]
MREPTAEIRKPQIVQAAFEAIRKNGLPMPSYDLIAKEAGISRQLIRHYFPDPEALMEGVCDHLAAAYRDCLMKGIVAAGQAERLPIFLDFYFNFLSGQGIPKPADDVVYDAMVAIAAALPTVRKNLFDQYTLLQHTIAHEVQISYPALPQTACREIGFLFVALMYGHWKMVASLGFSERYNRITREAVDRLIQSYCQRYDDPDI